ncbi:Glycosyltransferase, GT2 family [Maridesulfovibrio ferrireducens]|uniref:Glycosyltransferase, GT2 family n=1 Tax=Maridesulfovibrio ferrireducens TaxID=246191 RepID=A0A1G9ERS1_9BACT|nr:glycosyltransferase [Maridesulfovibrio ferrireducens]SDK78784.1 Glycosyltransferase, GT2 family [Maridesulfovibrio ferrireducens]
MSKLKTPLVTAIVSTYASECFMEGCLANLVGQTIFDDMEIIVIDAASPENEGDIVRSYQERYSNIRYIRTPERIGLYPAWNIGIREAKGKYLTNANTDDRKHPQCIEKLVKALEEDHEFVLAYSDCVITDEANCEFSEGREIGRFDWLDHDHLNLIRRCEIGPMPLWRASLHEEIGLFDEYFIGAGDYEFWLRASQKHRFIHLKEDLGLYLQHDNNLETRNMRRKLNEEYYIKSTYIKSFLKDSSSSKLPALLTLHTDAVKSFVRNQKSVTAEQLNLFEYHYYASALLLAKVGMVDDAIKMLDDWLHSVNVSKNIGHLLYALLLWQNEEVDTSAKMVSFVVSDNAHPELLARTLESIFKQQHENWELIVLSSDEELGGQLEKTFFDKLSALAKYPNLKGRIEALQDDKFHLLSYGHSDDNGISNTDEALQQVLNRVSGDYVCTLCSGEVLTPSYILKAVLKLGQDSEAGWVSPKALFFGTSAAPAWGVPFSLKQSLAEPPAPGASLFRYNAWKDLQNSSSVFSTFEKWGLWLALAEHGWKGLSLADFGVIINIVHINDLLAEKQRALHTVITEHPWWYSVKGAGEVAVKSEAVAQYDNAVDKRQRAEVVRTLMSESGNNSSVDSGKFRLALHYWKKKKTDKALELLEQILSDNSDNSEAAELKKIIIAASV